MPGQISYIVPCLGRTDRDIQATGPQVASIEDTFSHIYGSLDGAAPPSDNLRSELAIFAGLAEATLPKNPRLD